MDSNTKSSEMYVRTTLSIISIGSTVKILKREEYFMHHILGKTGDFHL